MWKTLSTSHLQRHHKKIVFPVALVNPVGKIAEIWHTLFVAIKLRNLNLQPN
jgi:hypothetical protein